MGPGFRTARVAVATTALLLARLATPAAADSGGGAPDDWTGAYSGDLDALSDEELERRTAFISERLDEGKLHAQVWQYGFTSGYSIGIVWGTVQALTSTDDQDEDVANGAVTAGKAVIGTARLLFWSHPGRHGAEAVEAIDPGTREGRLARLRKAESVLRDVESRSASRWDWRRHAGNFALNGAGAAIIAGLGGKRLAVQNGVVGVVVGTLMTFSMPWRGVDDAEAYRRLIRGDVVPDDPEVSWNLYPTGAGVGLRVHF